VAAVTKAPASTAQSAAKKKPRGKPFPKGVSGNRAGRKLGSRNIRTLLLAGMSDADRAAVVEKVIRQALRGCRPSQRLIIDRTEPPRRGSPVKFAMPEIKTSADIAAALSAVTAAMAAGKISPEEAFEIGRVIEAQRSALERNDLEARLLKLEGKSQ
jgi:hypothetical protein